MSTKLHDLETQAVLLNSIAPITATTNQTGSAVDLLPGDGNAFAILLVGVVAAGTTVTGKVQEAEASNGTWTDVQDGSFSSVTSSNQTRIVTFQRSQRFVRCVLTISGTDASAVVAAAVGQQRKRS